MTQCEHLNSKCQMPEGHGEDVECRFVCEDCGETYETDQYRCIQAISVGMTISMPIEASPRRGQTEIPKEVTQLIGEVFIEYALAENSLRTLLKRLPQHRERSNIVEDLERLELRVPNIQAQIPRETLRVEFAECARNLRGEFDTVHSKRNALAHGQLVGFTSTEFTISASENHEPNRELGTWYELAHPKHGKVTLSESAMTEVLDAAIELRRQVGILAELVKLISPPPGPGNQ